MIAGLLTHSSNAVRHDITLPTEDQAEELFRHRRVQVNGFVYNLEREAQIRINGKKAEIVGDKSMGYFITLA